ncbi:cache domain-containing protein [Methylobacterium tardum]|nr:cache domain-containing protein [Methylobacterium tardum]URD39900.1 cache domain-containing protein [Methylobacterium tardum]
MRAALETRAQNSLASNLRLLQQGLADVGGSATFSVQGDRLYVGTHAIDAADAAVDRVRAIIGGSATIFLGDTRIATNVTKADGTRAVGTKLAQGAAYDAVLRQGVSYQGEVDVLGTPHFARYERDPRRIRQRHRCPLRRREARRLPREHRRSRPGSDHDRAARHRCRGWRALALTAAGPVAAEAATRGHGPSGRGRCLGGHPRHGPA